MGPLNSLLLEYQPKMLLFLQQLCVRAKFTLLLFRKKKQKEEKKQQKETQQQQTIKQANIKKSKRAKEKRGVKGRICVFFPNEAHYFSFSLHLYVFFFVFSLLTSPSLSLFHTSPSHYYLQTVPVLSADVSPLAASSSGILRVSTSTVSGSGSSGGSNGAYTHLRLNQL